MLTSIFPITLIAVFVFAHNPAHAGQSIQIDNNGLSLSMDGMSIQLDNDNSSIGINMGEEGSVAGSDGEEDDISINSTNEKNYANIDMDGGNFSGQNLSGTNFINADLSNVSFKNSNLTNATFSNATFSNANFQNADLTGANFLNANIVNSDLRGAIVIRTNFTNVDFEGSKVSSIDFSRSIMTNVDITEVNIVENTSLLSNNIETILKKSNKTKPYINLDIRFAHDSDHVDVNSFGQIYELSQALSSTYFKNTHIIIEGHTDSDGDDAYNLNLSLRRAQSIINILSDKHAIDASRLTPKGLGESKPIYSNKTNFGKSINRRVTAIVSIF